MNNIKYSIASFIVLYYFDFIKSPFLKLLGNTKLGNTIMQILILVLNTTLIIIINYFSIIDSTCKLDQKDIEKKLKKIR